MLGTAVVLVVMFKVFGVAPFRAAFVAGALCVVRCGKCLTTVCQICKQKGAKSCWEWKAWRFQTARVPLINGEPRPSFYANLRVKIKIAIGFYQVPPAGALTQ